MPAAPAFVVQTSHPATFLERGVALPFTTPMLAGTRARPGGRGGPELLIPNPSGGRGTYVLPWSSLADFCQPTVHDARLTSRVAALRAVTPGTIRTAARRVAAEGFAGQDAQAAAGAALQADQQQLLTTTFRLLLTLVRQAEPPGANPVPPERERPAVLEERAKRAVARLAPRLGLRADRVAETLEELAAVYASIGIGEGNETAPAGRALGNLRRLQAELAVWDGAVTEQEGALAALVARVAAITIRCTEATLAEARTLLDDVPGLLARWRAAGEGTARLIVRPEWLLDGWEPVSALWRTDANDGARRRALAEISQLIPLLPDEAGAWTGVVVDVKEVPRLRRMVSLGEDWRTGITVIEMIARNEMIRALAA